jgi:nucleoside-diphosphate-sugar epimerase
MNIFITGGTGFVGTGVIRALQAAGHTISGLARSAPAAERLAAAGVTAVPGDLTDLAVLRAAAAASDAVVHCGFIHDFQRFAESARIDREAVDALIDGLVASPRPSRILVVTAGTAQLAPGRLATERDGSTAEELASPRRRTEQVVLAAATRGVRSASLRLPPSVHGPGDHGFVPFLIDLARRTGVSAYLGDGASCWPAVHRDDAAALYRLAVEGLAARRIPAGSALHAVAETGIPVRAIAAAIAARLQLPTEPRAADHFGWFAGMIGLDNPSSSAITRELTGWRPSQPGLLDDIASAAYADVASVLTR